MLPTLTLDVSLVKVPAIASQPKAHLCRQPSEPVNVIRELTATQCLNQMTTLLGTVSYSSSRLIDV